MSDFEKHDQDLRDAAYARQSAERPPEPDRLKEIRQRYAEILRLTSVFDPELEDIRWLLAEVDRLRAGVAERRDPTNEREIVAKVIAQFNHGFVPGKDDYSQADLILAALRAIDRRGTGAEPTALQEVHGLLQTVKGLQQRLEWVAAALHGDPLFGPAADEPLVRLVGALRAGGPPQDHVREALQRIVDSEPHIIAHGLAAGDLDFARLALSGGGPAREEPSGEAIVGKMATLEAFSDKNEKADAAKWNLLLRWVERRRALSSGLPAPEEGT